MLGEPTHPSSCRIRVVDDLGRPISDDKDVPGTDGNQAVGPDHRPHRRPDRPAGDERQGRGPDGQRGQRDDRPHRRPGGVRLGRRRHGEGDDVARHDPAVLRDAGLQARPGRREAEAGLLFGPPTIDPLDPLPSGQEPTPVPRPGDRRPERLVLDAARRKVAVRILLNEPVAGWPEGVFWLLALPAAAAGLGAGGRRLVAVVMGAGVALLPIFIGLAFTFLLLETYFARQGARRRLRRPGAAGLHGEGPGRHPAAPRATSSSAASNSRHPTTGSCTPRW